MTSKDSTANPLALLLSTYNGSRFLPELFRSLDNQSFNDWKLIVRDDVSKDNTVEIIKDFVSKKNAKVELIEDEIGNLGACRSFLYLLTKTQSGYYMFVDQDDVWLPDKIEKTLNKMLELENKYGKETPILVHTDLKVVDKNLNLISHSFWKYQGQNPEFKSLNHLLVQNNITGCTVMINRALRDLVKALPERAIMHDWWLGLIASTFGIIDYIPESLVLYRQHEAQDTGAREYSISYFYRKFMKNPEEAFKAIIRTFEQAKEFWDMYKDTMPSNKKRILLTYLNLPKFSTFLRLKNILKFKFFKQGKLRNLGFLVVMLFFK